MGTMGRGGVDRSVRSGGFVRWTGFGRAPDAPNPGVGLIGIWCLAYIGQYLAFPKEIALQNRDYVEVQHVGGLAVRVSDRKKRLDTDR